MSVPPDGHPHPLGVQESTLYGDMYVPLSSRYSHNGSRYNHDQRRDFSLIFNTQILVTVKNSTRSLASSARTSAFSPKHVAPEQIRTLSLPSLSSSGELVRQDVHRRFQFLH